MCKCHNCVELCFLAFLSDNCGWSWSVLFIKTVSDWALLTVNCWNKKFGKFNIFGKRNYVKRNVFSVIFSHFSQLFLCKQNTYFSLKCCSHICLHLWEHFSHRQRDSHWQDRIMDCFLEASLFCLQKKNNLWHSEQYKNTLNKFGKTIMIMQIKK